MASSPGPWRWDEGPSSMFRLRCADGRAVVQEPIGALQISVADAKLIAAAPEMATMLKEIEWWGESEHWQGVSACLFCRGDEPGKHHPGGPTGHSPDCRLAKLLSELP